MQRQFNFGMIWILTLNCQLYVFVFHQRNIMLHLVRALCMHMLFCLSGVACESSLNRVCFIT
jgi:hypothetical protein